MKYMVYLTGLLVMVGYGPLAVGTCANRLVVAANGGKMPVLISQEFPESGIGLKEAKTHTLMDADTKLAWLGDRFYEFTPGNENPVYYSVGDALNWFGVEVCVTRIPDVSFFVMTILVIILVMRHEKKKRWRSIMEE